jgi:ABC-type multidrug transport system ATPase subunit
MSPSIAVNAADISVDLVFRRRRRGASNIARLRRLTGSIERKNRSIFADVSFKIRRGEFVAVTIPGRGNDVLLGQVLTGLLDPDSGTVRRTGRWVFSPGGADLIAGGLSLRQNIHLVAGLLGYPGHLPEDIERAVLEDLDAYSVRNRPAGDLPYGLLRRLTTMTALHLPADVYCLAGPLKAGSQEERRAMRRVIKQRLQEGATVITIARRLPRMPVDRTISVTARKRRR